MSRTCNISCLDCKQTLWVGQSNREGWYLYGSEGHVRKMGAFLNAHEGHKLQFGDSEEFDFFEDVMPSQATPAEACPHTDVLRCRVAGSDTYEAVCSACGKVIPHWGRSE